MRLQLQQHFMSERSAGPRKLWMTLCRDTIERVLITGYI
jgi:hypothetical protein